MLLSRVADALYWMSRYLERAEHTARLIDVRLDLGLDRRSDARRLGFRSALREPQARRRRPSRRPIPPRSSTRSSSTSRTATRSLACVTAARENARQVREEISSDMWEQLNALFLRLKQARAEGTLVGAPALRLAGWSSKACTCSRASPTRRWGTAKAGSTCRSGASSSARARRRRSSICTSATRAAIAAGRATSSGSGLLRSCSALEAYCRYYTADLRPERIAEFLLLNSEFPRSVRFAAARVESALRAIAQLTGRGAGGRAERLAGRLHASLDYGQVDEILSDDPHAYLEASAATARRSTRRCIRATSRIRSSRRCRPERQQSTRHAVHHPARHAVHLRSAHQRERDGSAHAAAQRRRAALPALRPEHDARLARDDVSGSRRQHRPSLQHPRAAFAPDGRRPKRSSSVGAAGQLPDALGAGRLGAARRADGVGRVLGAAEPEPVRAADAAARRRSRARSAWRAATIRSRRVRRLDAEMYERFEYSPKSTRVDSPIDDALESRQGVCQDFAHIMIALVRQLGIPCRYVSGYLFQPA